MSADSMPYGSITERQKRGGTGLWAPVEWMSTLSGEATLSADSPSLALTALRWADNPDHDWGNALAQDAPRNYDLEHLAFSRNSARKVTRA